MAEPTSWKPWNIPSLDETNQSGEARTTAEGVELDEHESIETVEDWDDGSQAESVEDVEAEGIHLPSAEELEQLRKSIEVEAYAEGFAKGEAHGQESGHNKAYQETKTAIDQQVQYLAQLTAALTNPIEEQDTAIEQIILNSVVTITKAVIGQELESRPEQILTVVQQAVAALPGGDKTIKIFLHPDDIQFVEQHSAEQERWQLCSDAQLSRGGCRLKTDDSQLSATVEARIEAALEQFRGKQLAGSAEASQSSDQTPVLFPETQSDDASVSQDETAAATETREMKQPDSASSRAGDAQSDNSSENPTGPASD
ncbi:flagellar assembly protein FliH [Halioxenophilus aromaticivorans]|uniref:Flagellar assembly protein FliH n=1 Tax=Halioxenophilus aromaticivorans TaxID=1306992 RepID=A0AAV3U016_9ALTE